MFIIPIKYGVYYTTIIIYVEIKVIFADRMFVDKAGVRTCSGTGILPITL